MSNEELVGLIQKGIDTKSNLYQLYQQNTGMMFHIAKKFSGYAETEDLLQEAYFGICTAAMQYKPEKGEFSTYAYHHIYAAMSRYSKRNGSITISEHTKLLVTQYNKLISHYEKQGQNPPSLEVVAVYMGISEKTAGIVSEIAHRGIPVSLDTPIGEETDCCLSDMIQGSEGIEKTVVDEIQYHEMKNELWQQVEQLGPEPAHILHERYEHGATLKEVAEGTRKTFNQVRAAEQEALKKLKIRIRYTVIMDYVNEYIRSHALQGNGVGHFHHSWTSSTEKVAIDLYNNRIY